jgi:hypothetical protein
MVLDEQIKNDYNIESLRKALDSRIYFYTKVVQLDDEIANNNFENAWFNQCNVKKTSKNGEVKIFCYVQMKIRFGEINGKPIGFYTYVDRVEYIKENYLTDYQLEKIHTAWNKFKHKNNIDTELIKSKLELCYDILNINHESTLHTKPNRLFEVAKASIAQ